MGCVPQLICYPPRSAGGYSVSGLPLAASRLSRGHTQGDRALTP